MSYPGQSYKYQKGAALIVLVLAFIMATSVLVISNFSIDKGKIAYEKRTTQALAEAKEALIAYAVTYSDTGPGDPRDGIFGFLPCPDDGTSINEGVSKGPTCGGQYKSFLGRLPWKTLGIDPVKDGSGNCLWYAVSSEYKNSGPIDRLDLSQADGLSRSEMLNEDSNGSFILYDSAVNMIAGITTETRPVAIIIAPGGALPGQNRTYDNTTQCGGDYTTSNFLDVFGGIDNSSITLTVDFIDDFIASAMNNAGNFNDRIITISQADIFDEIKRRSDFTTVMENTTRELAECIAEFGKSNPATGGGCDLTACLQQCSDDQAVCYNQCANCSLQCDIDFDACIASGTKKNDCNKAKADCNNACPKVKQCEKACDSVFTTCESDCNTNCTPGGGGGVVRRLPWPAPLLLADYRDSQLYIEDTGTAYLGRFPVDVGNPANPDNSLVVTGNPGDRYLLESDYTVVNATYIHCKGLNTDAVGVVPNTYNSEQRRIWQNWKDHFFYAVAADYVSTPANSPTPAVGACTNCLNINGGVTDYTAIVMFSGERIAGQTRTVGPNDADTKQIISNYLEGNNVTDDGNYQEGATTPIFNDIVYCLDESLNVVNCIP